MLWIRMLCVLAAGSDFMLLHLRAVQDWRRVPAATTSHMH